MVNFVPGFLPVSGANTVTVSTADKIIEAARVASELANAVSSTAMAVNTLFNAVSSSKN